MDNYNKLLMKSDSNIKTNYKKKGKKGITQDKIEVYLNELVTRMIRHVYFTKLRFLETKKKKSLFGECKTQCYIHDYLCYSTKREHQHFHLIGLARPS